MWFPSSNPIKQIGHVYIWAHNSQGEIALGGHHKVVALAIKEQLIGQCYSVEVFDQGIEMSAHSHV